MKRQVPRRTGSVNQSQVWGKGNNGSLHSLTGGSVFSQNVIPLKGGIIQKTTVWAVEYLGSNLICANSSYLIALISWDRYLTKAAAIDQHRFSVAHKYVSTFFGPHPAQFKYCSHPLNLCVLTFTWTSSSPSTHWLPELSPTFRPSQLRFLIHFCLSWPTRSNSIFFTHAHAIKQKLWNALSMQFTPAYYVLFLS